MSSQPDDVLLVRDERGQLAKVRGDASFTWRDRYTINDALADICVNWASHPKGVPSMAGLPKHMLIAEADHRIAIAYQLLRPSVYSSDIAGLYILDISII